VVPWLIALYVEHEFHPAMSLVLGVIFALPFWTAARWLADSPYRSLVTGCWLMVALWALHLLISIVMRLRAGHRAPRAGA